MHLFLEYFFLFLFLPASTKFEVAMDAHRKMFLLLGSDGGQKMARMEQGRQRVTLKPSQ